MTSLVTTPLVLVNGEHAAGVAIAATDRGFTLADGVFETMRVHNGIVFRLEHHLRRLDTALTTLGIPSSLAIRQWVKDAVAQSGAGDASVRLTVTRGPGPGGLAVPRDVVPTVVVAVNPMPVFAPEIYANGLRAQFAGGRRNEHSATAGLKTLAYTDNVLGYLDARRAGVDDAIFLDTAGHCSEATSSNLFIWTGRELLTPPLACAVLPGITRHLVLDAATTLGIPVAERAFDAGDLLKAQEAFLTSSLRGIAPLVAMHGPDERRPLGSGTPGPITRQFSEVHAAAIAEECGR